MKKALIFGLIGAVALFVVAKKTNVFSYGSTFISQVAKDAKDQVPTKFEFDRIRNEIASLDGDISQMIRPIAEYKVEIDRLRKDIAKANTNMDEKKKALLPFVEKLEGNPKFVRCGNVDRPADKVRKELERQSESLKLQAKNVKAQQEMLDAKETCLKATQEQLAKVVSKKREYELRLAQLEALDQSLQVQRIASDIKIDTSRATQIEDALQSAEKRLLADSEELKLRAGEIANNNINLFEREPEPLDLGAIRNFLEGNEAPAKLANNK